MERNYVTVILCTEHSTGVPAANAIVTGSEDAVAAVVPADDLSHPAENHVLDQCEHGRYLVREPATAPICFNAADIPNDRTILTTTHTHPFNGPLSGTTRVSRYQKGKNQSGFYWSKRQ